MQRLIQSVLHTRAHRRHADDGASDAERDDETNPAVAARDHSRVDASIDG